MDRKNADDLLAAMVRQGEDVSDLLFMEGKPPLVDIHGRLHPFPIDTPQSLATPQLIEELTNYIINGNQRLLSIFEASGSCDCSYTVENIARFRANIYKQNGRRAIVMRKFPSNVPTLDELGLPQTDVRIALKKAVQWYLDNGYIKEKVMRRVARHGVTRPGGRVGPRGEARDGRGRCRALRLRAAAAVTRRLATPSRRAGRRG